MTTKIRLRRMGAKRAPFYRVVVADSRSPRDGRFIEEIGYYDPTKTPAVVSIDEERALKWLADGAQVTDTAKALLRGQGILAKFAVLKNGTAAPAEVAETVVAEEAPKPKRAAKNVVEEVSAEETPKAKRTTKKAAEVQAELIAE